ncbi:MAG: hypothetical protein OIF32_00355 [Campylobacterales bacterium]|nr:hypothetical protein [Campylobacterales bacterium]
MRALLLLLFFIGLLQGDDKKSFFNFYTEKEYEKSCQLGGKIFYKNRHDENFVQAFGFSCLNVDNIGMIANVPRYLKKTEKTRRNASYFSVIITGKKLLYQGIVDEVDMTGINLPKTDHIISKVFGKLAKKDYTRSGTTYIFNFGKRKVVKVDKLLDKDTYKVIVNEYENNQLKRKHLYW